MENEKNQFRGWIRNDKNYSFDMIEADFNTGVVYINGNLDGNYYDDVAGPITSTERLVIRYGVIFGRPEAEVKYGLFHGMMEEARIKNSR